MRRMIILSTLMVLGITQAVQGQVPLTLSYQGVLKDSVGTIVPDDDYDFIFRIYDVPSGGTALWTESQTRHVSAGILNVILGEVEPITLLFDEPYWLGVTIGFGSELDTRTILTGAPYALNARAVHGTHNEFPDSGYVGIGTTSPAAPLHVVGGAGTQVGIRFEGANVDYSSIYVNALQGTARPLFGYLRESLLYANHYLDVDDAWKVRVGPDVRLTVGSTGRIGIGTESPAEMLDVDGGIRLGNTLLENAGTIRWNGLDFEGYDGSDWVSMTGVSSGGELPPGTLGQTLFNLGTGWVATSSLYNDSQKIGVGTTSPGEHLHIFGSGPEIIKLESTADNFRAGMELKTPAGGDLCYSQLMKYSPSAIGSTAGIPLANLTRLFNHIEGGGLLLETTGSGDPIYFATTGGERMRIASNGNIGIGTADPLATLDVMGGNWDLDGTEGDIKIGNDTHRLKIGVATDGLGAGTAGIRMQGGLEKLILGAGPDEVMTVNSGGSVHIGSSTQTGQLSVWRDGFSYGGTVISTTDHGGRMIIYDESGYSLLLLRPDSDGEAGVLEIKRAPLENGFAVYGAGAGTDEPIMYVSGSERIALFDMSVDRDSCVTLPSDCIASHEILDEPGTASAQNGMSTVFLNSSIQTLLARTIIVPASGYIQVTGTIEATAHHSQGLASNSNFGVSDNGSVFPLNQDVALRISTIAGSGDYRYPVTVHSLFEVSSSGTYTYYILGQEITGNFEVTDMQLTLIYIPTAYGMVISTATPSDNTPGGRTPERPVLTQADIAAERIESESFNRDRIEREIARMSEELEALKRKVERESRDSEEK